MKNSETKAEIKKDTSKKVPPFLILAGFVVLGFWVLNWWLVGANFSTAEGGQFGDRFGATTSLFGGLTILGLIFTIYLQLQQMKESNNAFQQEMAQLQKQVNIQNFQRFTDTFFQMIDLKYKIVANYKNGKDEFTSFNNSITSNIYSTNDKGHLTEHYKNVIKKQADQTFGNYVSNFMEILNLISKKKYLSSRLKYSNILLAQLSNDEVIFLYYHLNICFGEQIGLIKPKLTEMFSNIFPQNPNHHILFSN